MASVLKNIDSLIGELSGEVSTAESACGWTPQAKAAIRILLIDLKVKVEAGQPVQPISLARGADSWGVIDGELLERLTILSNELRDL